MTDFTKIEIKSAKIDNMKEIIMIITKRDSNVRKLEVIPSFRYKLLFYQP